MVCLEVLRQQSHALNSRVVRFGNDLRHIFEIEIVVAFDVGDLFRTAEENACQCRLQAIPGHSPLVDFEQGSLVLRGPDDLNHNGALILMRLLWFRRLRKLRIDHVFLRRGHNHHEHDNEHQKNVNQRRDIRFRPGRTTACRGERHRICSSRARVSERIRHSTFSRSSLQCSIQIKAKPLPDRLRSRRQRWWFWRWR